MNSKCRLFLKYATPSTEMGSKWTPNLFEQLPWQRVLREKKFSQPSYRRHVTWLSPNRNYFYDQVLRRGQRFTELGSIWTQFPATAGYTTLQKLCKIMETYSKHKIIIHMKDLYTGWCWKVNVAVENQGYTIVSLLLSGNFSDAKSIFLIIQIKLNVSTILPMYL